MKYTYKCNRCGEKETVHAMKNPQNDFLCLMNKCKGLLFRVYQVPSVIFKGKGFYKTDN